MKKLTRFFLGLLVPAFMLAGVATSPAMAQEKAKAEAKEKAKEAKKEAKAEKGKSTTKVLIDNDKVRVFEVTYKPGDASPNVARPARVIRTLKGGTLESTYADGKKEKRETKAGEVIFREASTPYTPKNVGKSDVVLFVVYLKEPKK